MEKRYQIFISSTYKDLIDERQKVIKAILKLYQFPIGMEMFHADDVEQWEQIKKTIDMSDYYILILGRYCGTMIERENISYTEKEYNYARSRNIPILSFVIADNAKKESYGIETTRQQNAYKKFKKKVLKLPCEFWHTSDELAFQVASALSVKTKENNRPGWVQYNFFSEIADGHNTDFLAGDYNVYYYSGLNSKEGRLIRSRLIINATGRVSFFNNVKKDPKEAEYKYQGYCANEQSVVYIYLKNDHSQEHLVISLAKSMGNLGRFLGILSGLSPDGNPACIKIACFKNNMDESAINMEMLEEILCAQNVDWNNNIFAIEVKQKCFFFSDAILSQPE